MGTAQLWLACGEHSDCTRKLQSAPACADAVFFWLSLVVFGCLWLSNEITVGMTWICVRNECSRIYVMGGASYTANSLDSLEVGAHRPALDTPYLPLFASRPKLSVRAVQWLYRCLHRTYPIGSSLHSQRSAQLGLCACTTQVFDPATSLWSALAPMATPRFGLSCVHLSLLPATAAGGGGGVGVLYAVGGSDGVTQLGSAETYDVGSGVWTTLAATMTVAREGLVAVAI